MPTSRRKRQRATPSGVVLQPMRNLSATVDYYKIKVNNVISTIPSALALATCIRQRLVLQPDPPRRAGHALAPGPGVRHRHQPQHREAGDRRHRLVGQLPQASAAQWGSLAFEFNGTYLMDLKIDSGTGLGPYNCAGFYGVVCNGNAGIAINPLPKWKHLLRAIWSTPWRTWISRRRGATSTRSSWMRAIRTRSWPTLTMQRRRGQAGARGTTSTSRFRGP